MYNKYRAIEQRFKELSKGCTISEENKLEAIKNKIQPIVDKYKEHLSPELQRYWNSIKIDIQGSYANETNIRECSDIDVLVELQDIFLYDDSLLTPAEKDARDKYYITAGYDYTSFKEDLYKAIEFYYSNDKASVRKGNKSIKIKLGVAEADIIPCFSYYKFHNFEGSKEDSNVTEGICFFAKDGTKIVSFPKQHLETCAKKEIETNIFKDVVKIIKNIKEILLEQNRIKKDVACSYFIENLVYNCLDSNNSLTPSERELGTVSNLPILTNKIIDVVRKANHYYELLINDPSFNLKCANGQQCLFRGEAWKVENFKLFLDALNEYVHIILTMALTA